MVVQAAPQPGAAPDPHGSSSSSNSKPHGSGSSQDAGQPLTFSFGPRPSLASQEALQESLNTLDALPPMQQSSSHPQGQGEHHHEHHHHHHHGEHGEHGDHEHHNKTHMPLAKLQKIQPPKLPSNLHQLPGMAKEHLSGMAASAKEHLPQLKELGPEDQRHSPREVRVCAYDGVIVCVLVLASRVCSRSHPGGVAWVHAHGRSRGTQATRGPCACTPACKQSPSDLWP